MQEYFVYFKFPKLPGWRKRSANNRRRFNQRLLNKRKSVSHIRRKRFSPDNEKTLFFIISHIGKICKKIFQTGAPHPAPQPTSLMPPQGKGFYFCRSRSICSCRRNWRAMIRHIFFSSIIWWTCSKVAHWAASVSPGKRTI